MAEHVYNSSFKFSTLTAMSKDDYRKARHIITHIVQNPQSVQFREPVNWDLLGLLDYPVLILNPMDLGSVLQKLSSQRYQNIQQFLDDTQLIWDNCKNYNSKGSWIYSLADKLEKNCKKMLKNYFPMIPLVTVKKQMKMSIDPEIVPEASYQYRNTPDIPKISKLKKSQKSLKGERGQKNDRLYYEDEEMISIDDKMMLADKFRTLPASINAKIVEHIQLTCPTAFKDIDDRVQILVDNMDVITFKQLMEKIDEIQLNDSFQGNKKIKME